MSDAVPEPQRADTPGPVDGVEPLEAQDAVPVLRMPAGMLAPAGEAYDWYRRGTELLAQGNAAAAAELLAWAARAEPDAASIREAWARSLFDAGRFAEAEREFRILADLVPDDDYARFGLGLALWRLRQFPEAAEHLAMATVMRPDRAEYGRALTQVRATLAARAEAGLDPVGSADEGLG